MTKENVSIEFRIKKYMKQKIIFKTKKKHNDLMSEKHKRVYRACNYFETFLVLIFAVSDCFSISAFASLVVFSVLRVLQ